MTPPKRTSYLMRSIWREYYTNLGLGVALSCVIGLLVYLSGR